MPSVSQMRKTTFHSSPLAWWMLVRETASASGCWRPAVLPLLPRGGVVGVGQQGEFGEHGRQIGVALGKDLELVEVLFAARGRCRKLCFR